MVAFPEIKYATVETYYANIFVGCKNVTTGVVYPIEVVKELCSKYVDSEGLCVTVTPTDYIYTNGGEPGAVVGLINYPRFPSDPRTIRNHAITLAQQLKEELKQHRVSIMMPDDTIMLGEME